MSVSRLIQMGASGVSEEDDIYADWTHPDIANGVKNTTSFQSPHGIVTNCWRWSYDGTKLFIVGSNTDIHRHTASTAYDITSVS